jgi:hypothetical protein
MTYYRLYVRYEGEKGPMINVHEINAVDDRAAMRMAATYPEDFLELWQEERRVAAFKADRRPRVAA